MCFPLFLNVCFLIFCSFCRYICLLAPYIELHFVIFQGFTQESYFTSLISCCGGISRTPNVCKLCMKYNQTGNHIMKLSLICNHERWHVYVRRHTNLHMQKLIICLVYNVLSTQHDTTHQKNDDVNNVLSMQQNTIIPRTEKIMMFTILMQHMAFV